MTRIIWDGFDRWAANYNIFSKWDAQTNFNSGGFSNTGAFGDGRYMTYDFQGALIKNFSNASTFVVGLHFKPGGIGGGSPPVPFFTLFDGTTKQVTGVFNTATLRYELRSGGAGGTVLATASAGGAFGLWDWIEYVITIGTGTSGTCEIWRYGSRIANVSLINTAPSGTSQANKVAAGSEATVSPGGFSSVGVDNFYALISGAGSAPWNARLGEGRVFLRKPNANSAVTWTPSSGSNYQRVSNDPIDDSLNQYNADNVVGHEDLFSHAALPGGLAGTCFGLWHTIRHKKDDAGAHTVYTLQKNGVGGTQTTDTAVAVGNSFDDAAIHFEVNPATGSPYTISELNALLHGYGVGS